MWQPLRPGEHRLVVRAYDGTGAPQAAKERDIAPEGAPAITGSRSRSTEPSSPARAAGSAPDRAQDREAECGHLSLRACADTALRGRVAALPAALHAHPERLWSRARLLVMLPGREVCARDADQPRPPGGSIPCSPRRTTAVKRDVLHRRWRRRKLPTWGDWLALPR